MHGARRGGSTRNRRNEPMHGWKQPALTLPAACRRPGPSLSRRAREPLAHAVFPLAPWEREGPAAKRWEGEGGLVCPPPRL